MYRMKNSINYCLVALQRAPVWRVVWVMLIGFSLSNCAEPEPEQKPPVISVAPISPTATSGTQLVLDAGGSTDPEGKALTYSWVLKLRPDNSLAVITNPSSAVASLTPDKPGIYVLTVTVTDGDGQSATKEMTITVSIPGSPPLANAGPSGTVAVSRRVTLDGSKSSDPDGDKLTYKWTFKSKPTSSVATIINADKAVAEFTADLLGAYVLTLTVSDNNWPAVSADAIITATVPASRDISGSWTAADGTGGGNDYTPRNHFYTFQVTGDNQPVSLTMTSPSIDVGFYIFDPLGQYVDQYGSGFGRAQTESKVLNAGTHTVMAATRNRYDIGAYTIRGTGLGTDFTRVTTGRVKATDVSFGPEGGGGTDEQSTRNHLYTFDVTDDNAFVDINLQSAEMQVWFQLFGPSGAQVVYSYVDTPRYAIRKLNKGSYTLQVGSGKRDAIGKYALDIFGKVENLKQYVYDSSVLMDAYPGKNAKITYTLNVTADNTALDISLRSPDIQGQFTVYDPTGRNVAYSYTGNYQWVTNAVSKGQYRIVIEPANNSSGIGKYTLSVYGKFSDLKKQ